MTAADRAAIVEDCSVTCRQIAEMLNTVVDAQGSRDGQLVDTLTGIGKLARYVGDALSTVA